MFLVGQADYTVAIMSWVLFSSIVIAPWVLIVIIIAKLNRIEDALKAALCASEPEIIFETKAN